MVPQVAAASLVPATRCDEPLDAGESEHVLHLVLLAPRHQVVATEAGVGANDDRRRGPAGAQVRMKSSRV